MPITLFPTSNLKTQASITFSFNPTPKPTIRKCFEVFD